MNDHKFELLLPVNAIKQRFQSIFFNNYLSLCECFKKRFIKTINTYSKLLFDSNKQSYERGKQLMGQWWTSVWFRWMGTANGRVNHTRAQAETHVHSDKVRWGGGHAELMVLVEVGGGGCRVDWSFVGPHWNRMKPVPGQTYPKLFHLFFLQARGVKIEAWL